MDANSCSVYALAFTCSVHPDRARWVLAQHGRPIGQGATIEQISKSARFLGRRLRKVKTESKTILAFAREERDGNFIVETADHVVAVVDGLICDKPEYSNLMRVVQVYKVT